MSDASDGWAILVIMVGDTGGGEQVMLVMGKRCCWWQLGDASTGVTPG